MGIKSEDTSPHLNAASSTASASRPSVAPERIRAVLNARIDVEIARSKAYKAAGPALAGHGAGYCDYAAKVLLEVRRELTESERCSPAFKASECALAPAQMVATRESATVGEQRLADGAELATSQGQAVQNLTDPSPSPKEER